MRDNISHIFLPTTTTSKRYSHLFKYTLLCDGNFASLFYVLGHSHSTVRRVGGNGNGNGNKEQQYVLLFLLVALRISHMTEFEILSETR